MTSNNAVEKPIRGFLFACTDKTEKEIFDRMLVGTNKVYAPIAIRIREGDLIFVHNIDSDALYGVYEASSNFGMDIVPEAWGGKYPYQLKVGVLGGVVKIEKGRKILKKMGIKRNTPLHGRRLITFLDIFKSELNEIISSRKGSEEITSELNGKITEIKETPNQTDIEDEIPIVEATTLWDFPKQSYGPTPKGDNKYPGVTPAQLIWNMVWRYTEPGDLVVDPMCGSGTTIDVCRTEGRRAIGYDISPARPDIIQNDARSIPLEDNSVDLVFIDSPYGDNVRYNDNSDNIGNISSEGEEFYDELEKVMRESHRILKEGRVLGWLIGDQWVQKRFTPVGFKIYDRLNRYFETVDVVCVARRGQVSHTSSWYNRARRNNFYLRGFKYLFIVRKTSRETETKPRKIRWARYKK